MVFLAEIVLEALVVDSFGREVAEVRFLLEEAGFLVLEEVLLLLLVLLLLVAAKYVAAPVRLCFEIALPLRIFELLLFYGASAVFVVVVVVKSHHVGEVFFAWVDCDQIEFVFGQFLLKGQLFLLGEVV